MKVKLIGWEGIDGLANDFWPYNKEESLSQLEGFSWIFGSYITDYYDGYAFVMFKKNGKIYEVNGSHCSCNGLEGQWTPEETSVEAITLRLKEGTFGRSYDNENQFSDELISFLNTVWLEELLEKGTN